VFYVGCTTKPAQRLLDHIRAKSKGANGRRVKARIAEMLQRGVKPCKPTMTIIETTEDKTREKFWIRHLRSLNTALLNVVKVFKNSNIVQGNEKFGTPETVNVDSAVKALQKLQDSDKYGASRLEQALGKDGANNLLNDMYAAQRAGVKALSRQQMAKRLAKYAFHTTEVGALGYGLLK
jgi:hypothetical protein